MANSGALHQCHFAACTSAGQPETVYAALLYVHVFSLLGRLGKQSQHQPPSGSREGDADKQMMEIKKQQTERD